jgi:hypothetical protein
MASDISSMIVMIAFPFELVFLVPEAENLLAQRQILGRPKSEKFRNVVRNTSYNIKNHVKTDGKILHYPNILSATIALFLINIIRN